MDKVRKAETSKSRREQCKAAGLCTRCGASAKVKVDGTTSSRCQKCLDKQLAANKTLKEGYKKEGKCIACGKPAKPNPDGGTFNHCEYHSRKRMLVVRKSLQKGGSQHERWKEVNRRCAKRRRQGLTNGNHLNWAMDHSPAVAVLKELGLPESVAWQQKMPFALNGKKGSRLEPQRYSILEPKKALELLRKHGAFYYTEKEANLLPPQKFWTQDNV